MSKVDWELMKLVDNEVFEAIGITSKEWKFRMSPSGLINAAKREKKSDKFIHLREAVAHTLVMKYGEGEKEASLIKQDVQAFAEFINNSENVKKLLNH